MTICKFYAQGFCRFGNNCRFEHLDNNRDYYSNQYQKSYKRNDGRQTQPIVNTSNKVGFSFNRTLDSVSANRGFGQQMPFSSNSSNFGQKETQMSSQNRNPFQSSNVSNQGNQRTGTFSFNRALQQIPSDRPSSRSALLDDIEMDSAAVSRMQANSGSRESQTNTFGLFSQSNNPNLFGNKAMVSLQNQMTSNTNASIDSKSSSDPKLNDIYSKISELTESDKKQFESNSFVYRSIPLCPPPQSLCF